MISSKNWFERMKCTGLTYISSIYALRQLMLSRDKDIIKISPKGYALSNGIDYCCVGLKSNDGSNRLVQPYGKRQDNYMKGHMIVSNAGGARRSVCRK